MNLDKIKREELARRCRTADVKYRREAGRHGRLVMKVDRSVKDPLGWNHKRTLERMAAAGKSFQELLEAAQEMIYARSLSIRLNNDR